jgi:hypothetical protein
LFWSYSGRTFVESCEGGALSTFYVLGSVKAGFLTNVESCEGDALSTFYVPGSIKAGLPAKLFCFL